MVAKENSAARHPSPSQRLRAHGLRVTRGRVAMLELLQRSKTPLALADIHAALADETCDFVTVFRFMKTLEEKGVVVRQTWVDNGVRFDLAPVSEHAAHHHFLVCRQCHRSEPIAHCSVSRLQSALHRETGYQEIAHTLQFSGLCPRCQRPARGSVTAKASSVRGRR